MTLNSGRRVLSITAVLIALVSVATAQSGRRGTAKSTAPPNPPVPTATETQPKTKPPARIHLMVAADDLSAFERVPLSVSGAVLEYCVRRLGEANDVAPVAASHRMTRGEAIQAAKAETTRYVVWLEVRNELDDYGADVSTQSNRVYVRFTIFEPATAKIKKSGRAQHGAGTVGNVGVTVPNTRSPVYSDYAIKETARQAADKILDAFQIKIGGWPR